jgi:hypothetical protein
LVALVAAAPVPVSATVFEPALLESESVPLSVPVTVGANVTAMLQDAPAANELPQPLLCLKFVLALMLLMLSDDVPVFESVTFWPALVVFTVWLPKLTLVGDRLADAVPATPVPLKATAGTATAEFVENVRLPLTVAMAVGAKLTEYV